jgi:raffinose/stachyose/melibiose transport system substrate-binding protein
MEVKKMKRILIFSFILVLMLSLVATAQTPIKIKFFTGKVETVDLVDDMIAEFNKENPGIMVSQEFQKDASSVIKIKFAAGDVPDITTSITQDYIDQGLFLDLSDETQWWSRVLPSIKEMCTDVKTGKQYKIASNMTMAGLFYNKKLFSELGIKEATTWKEFVSNLEKIKANEPNVVPMFLAGKDSWTLGHLMEFMADGVIKQPLGTAK